MKMKIEIVLSKRIVITPPKSHTLLLQTHQCILQVLLQKNKMSSVVSCDATASDVLTLNDCDVLFEFIFTSVYVDELAQVLRYFPDVHPTIDTIIQLVEQINNSNPGRGFIFEIQLKEAMEDARDVLTKSPGEFSATSLMCYAIVARQHFATMAYGHFSDIHSFLPDELTEEWIRCHSERPYFTLFCLLQNPLFSTEVDFPKSHMAITHTITLGAKEEKSITDALTRCKKFCDSPEEVFASMCSSCLRNKFGQTDSIETLTTLYNTCSRTIPWCSEALFTLICSLTS